MLTYKDVKNTLPNTKGIEDADFPIECIVFQSTADQQKGLFVSSEKDRDLQKAISNGAVAAIWPADRKLPSYTPNHFPVFLAEDPLVGVRRLTETFKNKISIEKSTHLTELRLPKEEDGIVSAEIIYLLQDLLREDRPAAGRDEK